ncbi:MULTISPECIES: site-2 protease family protein [Ruminococcus]|uniref:Uncharacterized protein n=1 Tax=Ruminococcus flavefaciens TaxID=1265 RepID=A0A1M7I264_RUMFL|nr:MULTISPECIES: site-2 protease family protein [Ruminococcus]MCR4796433.1 site-2 protease family protein [Ruminococcus sp.]SHM34872.1 hypothetical protein SAMN04487860_103244 [Ruminococcus flavefaciens]
MEKFYRFILILISRGILLTALMPAACFAKAWVAKMLGDNMPESDGRLSLDFRRHTDRAGMMSTIILGFGFGMEMKHDISNLKHMKRDITLISLAAPVAYFIMYILLKNLAVLIYSISFSSFLLASIYFILSEAAYACLCFGVIALLPLPPLDGFQIFYQFSWPKFRRWYFSHYQKIMYWSRIILYGIFLLAIITDGELSLIGFLADLWAKLLLDKLIFFHVDFSKVTLKILKYIFRYDHIID